MLLTDCYLVLKMISLRGRTSFGRRCANISESKRLVKISAFASTDYWSTERRYQIACLQEKWHVCIRYVTKDREFFNISEVSNALNYYYFRPYDAKNPFLSKITINRELHKGGDRSCMHIEFDIEGSKMRYDAGKQLLYYGYFFGGWRMKEKSITKYEL